MKFKHLVTSGCSFSSNEGTHWPHYLASSLGLQLHNRGMPSAGNYWISSSAIYQTQLLLDSGVDPKEIFVCIMWTDFFRQDVFIDPRTESYKNLLNFKDSTPNPINFFNSEPNVVNRQSTMEEDGYLIGGAWAPFKNSNISNFKKKLLQFFSYQSLIIQSYEHMLRMQWYCQSKNISLINQLHKASYWKLENGKVTVDNTYRNIAHLHKMINFDNWVLWNNVEGLYEYAKFNDLKFLQDNEHPDSTSHKHYVDNFLIDRLRQFIN